ncbi:MAG: hypothetical protein PHZ23_15965 [Acidiphilium sp.]|nr:hypothetical protein [Acidiphilium sp.]
MPNKAAAMLRTLAAERDAALKQVRETCLQFLMDQGQEIDAALAAKPAAPTGETVRVRVAVWVDNEGGIYLVAKETDVDPYNDNPTAWITADVPIPGAEIAGTVEVSDAE